MWWLGPELRCGHVTIINRGITPKFAGFAVSVEPSLFPSSSSLSASSFVFSRSSATRFYDSVSRYPSLTKAGPDYAKFLVDVFVDLLILIFLPLLYTCRPLTLRGACVLVSYLTSMISIC
jgi:hypothetical protein